MREGAEVTTAVRKRKTRALKQTWCGDCQRWVGVMPGQPELRAYFRKEPRIARHKLRDTDQICPRSGFTLPAGLVMDR